MKKPLSPPDLESLFAVVAEDSSRLVAALSDAKPVDHNGRYLHWDQMRHRKTPEGLSHEEWWLGTATSRSAHARSLPFTGIDGRSFQFTNVDAVQELVHRIDQEASGRLQADDPIASVSSTNSYLVSSLIEEAIASSLLEGAATTRPVAKELLSTGRRPRDKGEQMVLNNYLAMQRAVEFAKSWEPLTPEQVLELHRIVTEGTLDDPDEAGRLQLPGEERVGVYWDNVQLHRPPPAEELPSRLDQLCAFANGDIGEGFLHPVVRAIVLHFWLGYDHPFADGNGRTARALFYWSMLRSGYWLAEYLSISTILRKAPAQYVRSYLHVETDRNDVTYFVIYQLGVIERALNQLRDYLTRKSSEIAEAERLMRGVRHLNHRQMATLSKALRDPVVHFTIDGHSRMYGVVYQTARTDLLELEAAGLVTRRKVANKFEFWPVPDLVARISDVSAE